MKKLYNLYPNPIDVTIDLAITQAARQSFPSFLALVDGLREGSSGELRQAYLDAISRKKAFVNEDGRKVLSQLAEISLYRLEESIRILDFIDLPKNVQTALELVQSHMKELSKKETKETSVIIEFLSKESVFTQDTTIRKPQIIRLACCSLYSRHGLEGGSIIDILEGIKKDDLVFSSFDELLQEVGERARISSIN